MSKKFWICFEVYLYKVQNQSTMHDTVVFLFMIKNAAP